MESNKGFFFAHMMVTAPVVFLLMQKYGLDMAWKANPHGVWQIPTCKSYQGEEKDCYPPKVQHGSPENGTLEYQIPFGNHYF